MAAYTPNFTDTCNKCVDLAYAVLSGADVRVRIWLCMCKGLHEAEADSRNAKAVGHCLALYRRRIVPSIIRLHQSICAFSGARLCGRRESVVQGPERRHLLSDAVRR